MGFVVALNPLPKQNFIKTIQWQAWIE